MRELGVNFEALGGMRVDRVARYDTVTLEKHFEEGYRDIETLCGTSYPAYHRGDLHSELWRLALLTKGSEVPVELFRGVGIIGIDTENTTIELNNGTKYSGDLLIGADGLQSDVRA
jgi:salicylate hydroxylase